MSAELFRYPGAAKDLGTLEYVFDAGEHQLTRDIRPPVFVASNHRVPRINYLHVERAFVFTLEQKRCLILRNLPDSGTY